MSVATGSSAPGLRERSSVRTTPTPAELRKQLLLAMAPYLAAVAIGVALTALAAWAYRHPAWTVQHVVIVGDNQHQSDASVRRALKSELNESFLAIDLKRLQNIVEDVPWVRSAQVQRDFPNGLRITIQEHQAVAWWGEAQGTQLVNHSGQIFEAQSEPEENQYWPVLQGPDDQVTQVLEAYMQLQDVLKVAHLEVKKLALSAHGNWQATLGGDIHLALGRAPQTEWLAQVSRMISTLPELRQRFDQALTSIDLRYPNGYAVALAGVSVGSKNNP